MRVEVRPTLTDGLEIGFFRMIQLGGEGRPEGLKTWADAFLSQDNYGANTGNNNRSLEPGNQLAGIDLRWKVLDLPVALYGQVVGEDEDKFLPNCLMFQYGLESWHNLGDSTLRVFAEYADLTSYWWTDDLVLKYLWTPYLQMDIAIVVVPWGIGQIRIPNYQPGWITTEKRWHRVGNYS